MSGSYQRPAVQYRDYVSILVHRVLAGHGPGVECSDCPALCHHCGHVGRSGDDHTCPCPYADDSCPIHPRVPSTSEGEGA